MTDAGGDNSETDDIIHAIRRIMAAEKAILEEAPGDEAMTALAGRDTVETAPPVSLPDIDLGEDVREAAQDRIVAALNRISGGDETPPTVLEALILERLDPLLDSWMAHHLPPLVERLLRAEMHRLILKALQAADGPGDGKDAP